MIFGLGIPNILYQVHNVKFFTKCTTHMANHWSTSKYPPRPTGCMYIHKMGQNRSKWYKFLVWGQSLEGGYFVGGPRWDSANFFDVQHLLNSDIGNSFQGIHITSGIFQLWRSEGIITQIHLKYGWSASLLGTILSLYASYFHMHISSLTLSFYKKFKCLSYHHLSLFFEIHSIYKLVWASHSHFPAT